MHHDHHRNQSMMEIYLPEQLGAHRQVTDILRLFTRGQNKLYKPKVNMCWLIRPLNGHQEI